MNTKTNAVTGESTVSRECDHNSMVANIVGNPPRLDPKHNWKCSDCGYVYKTDYEERQERILEVTQGRTIWNSDGSDGPCLICAPSFEDIQAMAGFPVDDEGRALVVDEEENDDDTRTIGLPSNEEAEADDSEADEIEERETPYRLRDAGSEGGGESYAERNA